MPEAVEGDLSAEALAELRDWLMNAAPTCGNQTYVAGVVGTRDVVKLFDHITFLRAALSRAEAEREEAQIAWKKIASFTEMHWQGAGAKLCGDWLYDEIVKRAHEGSRAEEALDDFAHWLAEVNTPTGLSDNARMGYALALDHVTQRVEGILSRSCRMEEPK